MAGAVFLGSVVGMVANTVAAVYSLQSAGLNDDAAASCDAAGNATFATLAISSALISSHTQADTAQSVQAGSEALTLLLVTVAFFIIVSWSVALARLAERGAESALLFLADNSHGGGGRGMQELDGQAARLVGSTMQVRYKYVKKTQKKLLCEEKEEKTLTRGAGGSAQSAAPHCSLRHRAGHLPSARRFRRLVSFLLASRPVFL